MVHLNDQGLHTPWQQRVFTKILGLQYKVVYKQGNQNGVVDALSRRSHGEVLCCSISVVQPKWCQSIGDGYLLDEEAKRLLSNKLTLSSEAAPHFSLHEGLIRYKDRIWLGF